MNLPEKLIVVDLAIYKRQVALCRTKKELEILADQCAYSLPVMYDGLACVMYEQGNHNTNPYMVVYLGRGAKPGIIAHEAFHMAMYVMECIGYKGDENGHEPLAYLIEYLVEKFTQGIRMKNTKVEVI